MVRAVNLGFPRIGPQRQLKRVIEAHWRGDTTESEVLDVAATLRADG